MTVVEWSLWANEQAFTSSCVIAVGGAVSVSVAGGFSRYIGVMAIIIAVIVLILEYPRGTRPKGQTTQRRFQKPVAAMVMKLGPLSRNYYARFVSYMILSVPCCLTLPTMIGGLSLIISCILYFVAAYQGEQWTPVKEAETSVVRERYEPTAPPPRLPMATPRLPPATQPPNAHLYTNQTGV